MHLLNAIIGVRIVLGAWGICSSLDSHILLSLMSVGCHQCGEVPDGICQSCQPCQLELSYWLLFSASCRLPIITKYSYVFVTLKHWPFLDQIVDLGNHWQICSVSWGPNGIIVVLPAKKLFTPDITSSYQLSEPVPHQNLEKLTFDGKVVETLFVYQNVCN